MVVVGQTEVNPGIGLDHVTRDDDGHGHGARSGEVTGDNGAPGKGKIGKGNGNKHVWAHIKIIKIFISYYLSCGSFCLPVFHSRSPVNTDHFQIHIEDGQEL